MKSGGHRETHARIETVQSSVASSLSFTKLVEYEILGSHLVQLAHLTHETPESQDLPKSCSYLAASSSRNSVQIF